MRLAIVCGLAEEAAIIGQPPGATVIVGAGDAVALASKLEAAIAVGADRVISVGICGAISTNPEIGTGTVVTGVSAQYELSQIACDWAWTNRMHAALVGDTRFGVEFARFAWSETAVARLVDKAALRASTGADCVDEETFLVGSIAAAHGLPWAALRVVCDPALFELPPAALVKLTAAGADDMGAILASIAGDIWQIPELIQLAWYRSTAMASLRAVVSRIGPDFAAA